MKNLHILYFRQGNNPHPQFFFFEAATSDIRKVVERCKRHCELMNLRFVQVRPAFVDMDEAETKQLGPMQETELRA